MTEWNSFHMETTVHGKFLSNVPVNLLESRNLSAESKAVSGEGEPIGGWLACDWHVAKGKICLDPTICAQVSRSNPHRG
jgi:hypothetical protein